MKKVIKIKNNTWNIILGFLILLCFSWAPRTVEVLGDRRLRITILGFGLTAASMLLVFSVNQVNEVKKVTLATILSCTIYLLLNNFYVYESTGKGIYTFIVCCIIAIQSMETKAKIFTVYKEFIVIMTLFGIICYLLYMLDIRIVPYEYKRDTVNIYRYYIDYKLSYLMYTKQLVRLCVIFDEPGAFGTIAAFLLCADKINLRKKGNVILLIGGVMSLSLAFFILIATYYFIIYIKAKKKKAFIPLFIVALFILLQTFRTGNAYIDHVLDRMIITNEGLSGDNRSGDLLNQLFKSTLNSSSALFGHGAGYARAMASPKTVSMVLPTFKFFIIDFGIIGTLFMLLPMFVANYFEYRKINNAKIYILFSLISLYQRPYIFWVFYFGIFVCGIAYTSYKYLGDKR